MKLSNTIYLFTFIILFAGCGIWNDIYTTNKNCNDFLTFYEKKISTNYTAIEISNELIDNDFKIKIDTIWRRRGNQYAPLIQVLNYQNSEINSKVKPKIKYVELNHLPHGNFTDIYVVGICLSSAVEISKDEANQISKLVYADFLKLLK